MKTTQLTLAMWGLALSSAALAQPSDGFFVFSDRESGRTLCAQYAPSPDWVQQAGGPYQDSLCSKLRAPEPPRQDLPALPPGLKAPVKP